MIPKLPLLLLLPLASALNNVIIPLPYPECNTCVDSAVNSCPGDYETRAYANCLCAGDGGPRIVNCVSTCNAVDTLPMAAGDKVAGGWYSYCIMFFPELCAEAEFYVQPDWFAEKCGPGANKGVGFGKDGDPAGNTGSGGSTGGSSGTGGNGNSSGSGGSTGSGASSTGGAGFGSLGTGSASKTTGSSSQATSAAGSKIHPAGWGVMVGLGMMGLNM